MLILNILNELANYSIELCYNINDIVFFLPKYRCKTITFKILICPDCIIIYLNV